MTQSRIHVDNNGRIIIPSHIRKELHIMPGDVLVARVIDNEIRMVSLNKVVKEAQLLIRQYVPKEKLLVDELIQSRKDETKIEEMKVDTKNAEEQL